MYIKFWTFLEKLISKNLGLFASILTVADKYSLLNSENLQQTIQTQLSNK